MDSSKLKQLLADYAAETISKPDLMVLLDYVSALPDNTQLDQFIDELLQDMEVDTQSSIDGETLYQRITGTPLFNERPTLSRRRYWRWAGTAAAILVIAGMFVANWNERGGG